MDTKSTNSKRYPLLVKALCVVLSTLCFMGAAFCGVYAAASLYMRKQNGEAATSFYDTELFRDLLKGDLTDIADIVTYEQQMRDLDTFAAQREKAQQSELQRFRREKAAIIRSEVYYVATHYDQAEDDYYYEAYMRDFSTTTTTAPESASAASATVPASSSEETSGANAQSSEAAESVTVPAETTAESKADDDALGALPTLTVDERAPYNVRYCQKLVNTVSGLDWLQYASLVRSEAFYEKYFLPDFGDYGHQDDEFSYAVDDRTAYLLICDAMEKVLEAWQNKYEYQKISARQSLDDIVNLQYLAVDKNGKTYTNQENASFDPSSPLTIKCKGGKVTIQNASVSGRTIIEQIILSGAQYADGTPFDLTVTFADPMAPGDHYAVGNDQFAFSTMFPIKTILLAGIGSLAGLLVCLIALLRLCGHKTGADGITLAFIDRLPTDLHFLFSGAAILGMGLLFLETTDTIQMYSQTESLYIWKWFVLLALCILGAAWLIGLEWLTSTVRIKKAGQSYFKRFILWKLLRWLGRHGLSLLSKGKKGVLYVLEKPKKIRYIFLLATILYGLASVIWVLIVTVDTDEVVLAVFGVALLTIVFVSFFIYYLRTLDTIIDSSCDRSSLPIPDTEKMPPALRTLAENLSMANTELDKAVAQAVRDARTKTELITNVSHDLKTPLTSIISYVDLLKQCNITDDTVKEYLRILDEKSANLKRLIEDLIEASKVSTGNVELHCTPLNLSELAMQAVVDATPELEERGLEVKFAESGNAPIVFADGQKTHRVLENLLSNVKKYAADHSRVYIRVSETDEYGIFEIKNISRDALDIDPQELMERFVRGDQSRSQDGNGLGLSIAQQLCAMQGGRLDIEIDGDLFKATVRLPKADAEEAK